MSGADESRVKRLRYRCAYRGIKEMDLILRRFAGEELGSLTAQELDEFEALLEQPDDLLYRWISGAEPAKPGDAMLNRLKQLAQRGPDGTL